MQRNVKLEFPSSGVGCATTENAIRGEAPNSGFWCRPSWPPCPVPRSRNLDDQLCPKNFRALELAVPPRKTGSGVMLQIPDRCRPSWPPYTVPVSCATIPKPGLPATPNKLKIAKSKPDYGVEEGEILNYKAFVRYPPKYGSSPVSHPKHLFYPLQKPNTVSFPLHA